MGFFSANENDTSATSHQDGNQQSDKPNDFIALKLKTLEKQNEIMRKALEFYADANTWNEGYKYTDNEDATIFTDGTKSGATVDKGSRAYRTLKACTPSGKK